MSRKLRYVPVIIVGAGRSGTNMLRDVLCMLPGLGTWPCDEINYIWRHGNAGHPTDELSPDLANNRVQRFIRAQFDRRARTDSLNFVVEKTCANSLRVGFVRSVLPDAKFIHIIRDGRDVAASAAIRWNASFDLPYLLRKARFVPWTDMPYYAGRYLYNRLYRLMPGRQRLAFWGPHYDGSIADVRGNPLAVACALQWRRCVERSLQDLDMVPSNRVMHILYEEFVVTPAAHLRRIVDFVGAEVDDNVLENAVDQVSVQSIGRWKQQIPEDVQASVEQVVQPMADMLATRPDQLIDGGERA